MIIKPFYETSYIVQFRRGKDIQKTEVVEATERDVLELIFQTFKDRISQDTSTETTKISVVEFDKILHEANFCWFKITQKGCKRSSLCLANMSPRQARITFERAIIASK